MNKTNSKDEMSGCLNKFSHSPRSRRLEVMGAGKNRACERDMQGERRRLPKEAHENCFYSLSESAEDSY